MEVFGWPNLSLIPNGGFMGMPSSQIPGEMRVIDIYRREEKIIRKLDFH